MHQPSNDDVYTSEEQAYFMANPTEIAPRVFLSSLYVASNRDVVKAKLEITHMVNVSNSPNPFPGEFEYLSFEVQDHPLQQISVLFPRFLEFMAKALKEDKGNVLIFSARGVSRCAAFAIAWIMEELQKPSFYESFVFLKDRRYVINPNHGFVRQLIKWGHRKPSEITKFQCHCGACVFGSSQLESNSDFFELKSNLSEKSIVLSGNILACHCSAADNSLCPLKGCDEMLEKCQTKLSYFADSLKWSFVNPEFIRVDDLQFVTVSLPPQICRPGWTVYRCRTCHYATHASFTSAEKKIAHYAIVSNIPVVVQKAAAPSVSDGLNPQFRLSTPPVKTSSKGGSLTLQSSSSNTLFKGASTPEPIKRQHTKPSLEPVNPMSILK
jgi:atypical dual specificity phosphatase